MGRKPNNYNLIIEALKELHTQYPSFEMSRHISTAFADYGDIWGLSDKEFLFALNKYRAELEMDVPRETDEAYIRKIEEDAKNLSIHTILENKQDY